jgi:hypothetical protein
MAGCGPTARTIPIRPYLNLSRWRFQRVITGACQLNLVLLHVLEDRFKLKLHPEALLAEFAGDEDEGPTLDIKGLRSRRWPW